MTAALGLRNDSETPEAVERFNDVVHRHDVEALRAAMGDVFAQVFEIEGEGRPPTQSLLCSPTLSVRDVIDAEMREYLASLQTAGGAGWKRS